MSNERAGQKWNSPLPASRQAGAYQCAWGVGELRSPRTIAGGVGNPPRVPITIVAAPRTAPEHTWVCEERKRRRGEPDARIVGRRFIEELPSLQEQKASRWSSAISRVLCPRSLPRAGDGHSSRPLVAGRLVRPTWSRRRGPRRRGDPAAPIRSCFRWGLPCPSRRRESGVLLPRRFTLA